MEHVAALELASTGKRGSELRNTWRRQSSTQQGDETPGPRGNTEAHLSKEVSSGAAGHVTAQEPTSAGRCGLKLQLTWQRVDARHAHCLDLELVCGGTRSSGCRQRPRAHLGRGCEPAGEANFSVPRSVVLSFYSTVDDASTINEKTSTAGLREVPELKVWERPPPT
jgi:hypothetical protein